MPFGRESNNRWETAVKDCLRGKLEPGEFRDQTVRLIVFFTACVGSAGGRRGISDLDMV